jgi:glycosyltransferase involved in cell wall biosynthesis
VHTHGYVLREIPIHFSGRFHWHYFPTLQRELARAQPDIFHIDEEPYNLATWLALRALARTKTPSAKALFFSWQNIARRYPPPFSWMEHAALQQAHAAIVGNAEAQAVWQTKGCTKPMRVIPQFGVDELVFAPSNVHFQAQAQAQSQSLKPFTIGYAGRVIPEKGIALAIEALQSLPAARLIVLGNGPLLPALHTYAKSLELDERVIFRAPVASTAMPAFYRELDALVLPSLTRRNWKEQFGRVLIEAMACGVPVVGSNSGEIPNVIGDAGLVFPEDNAEALLECLRKLHQNPSLRAELAQRGRQRVLAHYTMRRVAEATVDFYRALL